MALIVFTLSKLTLCVSLQIFPCFSTIFHWEVRLFTYFWVRNTHKYYILCVVWLLSSSCLSLCGLVMQGSLLLCWLGKSQPNRWLDQSNLLFFWYKLEKTAWREIIVFLKRWIYDSQSFETVKLTNTPGTYAIKFYLINNFKYVYAMVVSCFGCMLLNYYTSKIWLTVLL